MDKKIYSQMKKDRSNWRVRKVSFAEADELDNEYYSSLSELERLEILMDLRSMYITDTDKIATVVRKRHIKDSDEI